MQKGLRQPGIIYHSSSDSLSFYRPPLHILKTLTSGLRFTTMFEDLTQLLPCSTTVNNSNNVWNVVLYVIYSNNKQVRTMLKALESLHLSSIIHRNTESLRQEQNDLLKRKRNKIVPISYIVKWLVFHKAD